MNAPELGPTGKEIRIHRKGPVGWLNLGLLFDTGFLAAISAATDSRTSRREVLAALDAGSGARAIFDQSAATEGDYWFDYVADLGDGFDATHSIAWLIGRDYLGIGAPGQPVIQPVPPDRTRECPPEAFPGAVLPAGRMLILGGDLVYPFATQAEYEARTIGPYQAARPWQLDAEGNSAGRLLFSIPGNHDWYDGLGAFVQRFCQPERWMGCWEVQQRRSYFAIRLPHRVWIWGVDLATADDFDAPQLDYFKARAGQLADGDLVILCVPKPAWVDRKFHAGKTVDQTKSWQSWNKIDHIAGMVTDHGKGARIGAILSGDLHHYSRYAVPTPDPEDATALITCGGGGAFLVGTAGLPPEVEVGGPQHAQLAPSAYPDAQTSTRLTRKVFRLPTRHWNFCTLLGAIMLTLAWYLDTAGPAPILRPWFDGFWPAFGALLTSSPVPLLLLAAMLYGFVAFARSGGVEGWWRPLLAASLHMLAQLALALVIAGLVKFYFWPLLPLPGAWGPLALPARLLALMVVLLVALALGWAGAGLLFAAYLLAANATLRLHGLEVYSAQAIEDWKCFLRIRVHPGGVAIYPIGLDTVCHDWTPLHPAEVARTAAAAPDTAMARTVSKLRAMTPAIVPRKDTFMDDRSVTHLYAPATPLAPHLIEPPVIIRHKGLST